MDTEYFLSNPAVIVELMAHGIWQDANELAEASRLQPLTDHDRREIEEAIRTLTRIVGAEQMEAA